VDGGNVPYIQHTGTGILQACLSLPTIKIQDIFTKFGGYVDGLPQGVKNGQNMIPSKIQLADDGHVPPIQHTGSHLRSSATSHFFTL